MNSVRKHLGMGLALTTGVALALILCVQCVRTYLYVGAVLVPQQAEREADRQAGALVSAARAAGVSDAAALEPVLERVVETNAQRVIWMRLLDQGSTVLAVAGSPAGTAKVPSGWWQRIEKHESPGQTVETPNGKAFTAMLPFRLPRPPRDTSQQLQPDERGHNPPPARHPLAYVLEIGVRLDAVGDAFQDLRENLVFGLCASLALLASMIVIGLRTPVYVRGKYLERELQLARSVQRDLLPKSAPLSPHIDFAAAAVAADHVGGDFYDVFETDSGKVSLVLGDISGKGIPAALLASVVQGAIRSSSVAQHETACRRINRMLLERTASEQFATLFWGVFEPISATLRYVNAGQAGPMLFRAAQGRAEKLSEGGPVLGLLPDAVYSAGVVQIEAGDTLVVYSDGITEAANEDQQEFGEEPLLSLGTSASTCAPGDICRRIMEDVSAFSRSGSAPDDRTLLVIRFPLARAAMTA